MSNLLNFECPFCNFLDFLIAVIANFSALTELKEIDECIWLFRVFISSNIGVALWSCIESFARPAAGQEVIAAKLFQFDTPHLATANAQS